jgi:hypothetical protein
MLYKEDWEVVKERFTAFFANEDISCPLLQVTAPKNNLNRKPDWNWVTIVHDLEHPERALQSYEYYCQHTFFRA